MNRTHEHTASRFLTTVSTRQMLPLLAAIVLLIGTQNTVSARVHRKLDIGKTDNNANHLVFSKDGRRLVSYHNSRLPERIAVWDADSGALIKEFAADPTSNQSFYGLTAGDTRAVVRDGGTLYFFDIEKGTLDRTLECKEVYFGGNSFLLSPEGSRGIFTGRSPSCNNVSTIYVVDLKTGEILRQQQTFEDGEIGSIAISPDGKTLAITDRYSRLQFRDTTALALKQEITSDRNFGTISFSANGQSLIAETNTGFQTRVWDVASGAVLATLTTSNSLSAVARDIDRAVGSRYGNLYFWDIKHEDLPEPPDTRLKGNALEQLGQLNQELPDIAISIPPVVEFSCAFTYSTVALSPDGKRVALADEEGGIRLYDWEDVRSQMMNRPFHTLEMADGIYSTSLAQTLDGTTIASGNSDGTISLIDTATHQVRKVLQGAEEGDIQGIVFSTNGNLLAFYADDYDEFRICDVSSGRALISFDCNVDDPYIEFSPDGTHVAWLTATSQQSVLHLVELQSGRRAAVRVTGRKVGSFLTVLSANSNRFAFTPVGTTVVFPSLHFGHGKNNYRGNRYRDYYNCCVAFNLQTGSMRVLGKQGESRRGIDGRYSSLAFSPDGSTLALGVHRADMAETGNFLELIDMKSGRLRTTFKGYADSISDVACSPNGVTVATAANDEEGEGMIQLRDIQNGAMQTLLKALEYRPYRLLFSHDGRTLVSANAYGIDFWHASAFDHLSFANGTSVDNVVSVGQALKDEGYLKEELNTEFHLRAANNGSALSVSLPEKALANQQILDALADDLGALMTRERFGDNLTVHFCDEQFAIVKTTTVPLRSAPTPPADEHVQVSTKVPPTTPSGNISGRIVETENRAPARQADAERIQGGWQVTGVKRAGRTVEVSGDQSYTFDNGTLVVRTAQHSPVTMSYVLNETTTPARLDLTWNNRGQRQVSPMIYSLDNNTLTICYAPPNDPRPGHIATVDGDRLTVITFDRIKN